MNRRRILILAIAALLLGGFAVYSERNREPVYEGRTVTEWLDEFTFSSKPPESIRRAIRAIGTNAIPVFLRMLQKKDSALEGTLRTWSQKQRLVKKEFFHSDSSYHVSGANGFYFLGEAGKDAVPALIQIYEHQISPSSQTMVICSLGFIGPSAKPAIPTLLQWTTNQNSDIRWRVFYVLGQIHQQPDLVLPVMLKGLNDNDALVRTTVARGLQGFGADAKPAVPALILALNDQQMRVRKVATNALRAIDSEAAAKAGIK